MKKITLLLLSVVLLAAACKENKEETKKEPTFEENLTAHYMTVYKKSMRLNDYVTASSSLNSYFTLVGDSARNASPYLDTLIILYQEIRQFAPVFVLSDEYLKQTPNDTDMLILNTGVAQLLGGLSQVSERCLQLAVMFPNERIHMFNYAASLIEKGQTTKGEQIYKDILNDPKSKNESIPFNTYDQNGQPRQSYVKARVGAYMKLGQLQEALKNKNKAISYYRKATKEDSEFRPAYQAILDLTR